MKYSIIFVATLILLGNGLRATSKRQTDPPVARTDQVEMKTDRFSGATTITLKPQLILEAPDHFITMSLEAKFGDKKIRNEIDLASAIMSEVATIRFESQANIVTDFGDQELLFSIDGKKLKIGESAGGISKFASNDPRLRAGFRILKVFANSIDTTQLKQVVEGTRVEMRLGKFEFVLSTTILGNLREFNTKFMKLSLSGAQKGKHP